MVQAIRFMRFGISKRIFRNIPVTYSAVSANENLILLIFSDFCGEKPKTIDEYILGRDADKQEELRHIRQILRDALPEAEERISWSMLTYWKGHNIDAALVGKLAGWCGENGGVTGSEDEAFLRKIYPAPAL